jgi:hypothetical protein
VLDKVSISGVKGPVHVNDWERSGGRWAGKGWLKENIGLRDRIGSYGDAPIRRSRAKGRYRPCSFMADSCWARHHDLNGVAALHKPRSPAPPVVGSVGTCALAVCAVEHESLGARCVQWARKTGR